jgi:hypothetical protein
MCSKILYSMHDHSSYQKERGIARRCCAENRHAERYCRTMHWGALGVETTEEGSMDVSVENFVVADVTINRGELWMLGRKL